MNLTKIIDTEYEHSAEQTHKKLKSHILSKELSKKLLETYKESIDETNRALYDETDIIFYDEDPTKWRIPLRNVMKKNLTKIEYTQNDITSFVTILAQEKDSHYGETRSYFLTEMINTHFEKTKTQEEYFLFFDEWKIAGFCSELTGATVHIFGDVDRSICYKMYSGKVIVEGNASGAAGMSMINGTLIIQGNASFCLGQDMKGGEIILKGNAKGHAAEMMRGGDITIKGNADEPICRGMREGTLKILGNCPAIDSSIEGGTVYHKEKCIYPE